MFLLCSGSAATSGAREAFPVTVHKTYSKVNLRITRKNQAWFREVSEEDANKVCKAYNLDSGFQGKQPPFLLQKSDPLSPEL